MENPTGNIVVFHCYLLIYPRVYINTISQPLLNHQPIMNKPLLNYYIEPLVNPSSTITQHKPTVPNQRPEVHTKRPLVEGKRSANNSRSGTCGSKESDFMEEFVSWGLFHGHFEWVLIMGFYWTTVGLSMVNGWWMVCWRLMNEYNMYTIWTTMFFLNGLLLQDGNEIKNKKQNSEKVIWIIAVFTKLCGSTTCLHVWKQQILASIQATPK